jgi:hypothetical protein
MSCHATTRATDCLDNWSGPSMRQRPPLLSLASTSTATLLGVFNKQLAALPCNNVPC